MALNINGTTGISGVDGSNSAPALTGTDSNTGINFGSDIIDLNTGGSSRFKIGAAGQLGVAGANYGTSGQALLSQGASAAPQWGTVSAGITVADIWRNTTSHQGNTSPLQNWERPDSGNQGYLGTGVTNTSGTFSFPTTGIWHIQFFGQMYIDNTTNKSHRSTVAIKITTNNSSYTVASQGHVHWGGGGFSTSISTLGTASAALLFDCTDVSQQKVQFEFGAGQGFEYIRGDSSYNETYATFIRLGDT
jgi:hypothetical protein